jgi:Predicted nucleotidyltransferases
MKNKVPDKVAKKYAELLHAALGSKLREVWLFGSRARGDFHANSDYDILVVAEGDRHELSDIAVDYSYSILCEFSELIGPLTYSPSEWEREKRTSLGRTVLRDGVLLYESR